MRIHVAFQRQMIAVVLLCYLGLGAQAALVALAALSKHCRLAWKWTADPAAALDLPSYLLILSGVRLPKRSLLVSDVLDEREIGANSKLASSTWRCSCS